MAEAFSVSPGYVCLYDGCRQKAFWRSAELERHIMQVHQRAITADDQTAMDGSSSPTKMTKSPPSGSLMLPGCHVCGWRPESSEGSSAEKMRLAMQKHIKRNHESQDHSCPICKQSFRDIRSSFRLHVAKKHPELFALLFPREFESLNSSNKALKPRSAINKIKQSQRISMGSHSIILAPALNSLGGTVRRVHLQTIVVVGEFAHGTHMSFNRSGAEVMWPQSIPRGIVPRILPQQLIQAYLRANLSGGYSFQQLGLPGFTQASVTSEPPSKDSVCQSVEYIDNITETTYGHVHSKPEELSAFEAGFQLMQDDFLISHVGTCTPEPKMVDTSCEDGQTDTVFISAAERGVYQTETGSDEIAGTPGTSCGIVSPQTHEHSSDGDSSHSTETSTPESSSFLLAEYSEDEEEGLGNGHPFMDFKASALVRVFEAFLTWKESPSGEDAPCDGAGEPNDATIPDKGKGKDTAKGKRTWAVQSETSKRTTDGSGPSSSQPSTKRSRISNRKLTLACPYTKKDSISYKGCYKYKLSRIRDVKQHLARCHRNPLYCPRCMGTFETEEERDGHIREFSCPLRPSITFDGITESQRQQLAKKSTSNTSEEAQWFAVFDILFPGHDPRPESPYIDRELFQDITLYQDFLTSNGPRILSDVLTRRGAITWNLPNEEHDLAAFQQTVFEEGLHAIFNQWVARRSSRSTEDQNISSGSGSPGQDTPLSSSHSRERVGSISIHGSGATLPEFVDSLPIGGPMDAVSESEDIPGSSSNQIPFDLGLDGDLGFEYGNVDLPSGFVYEASDHELMHLMDDAQASPELPQGLD